MTEPTTTGTALIAVAAGTVAAFLTAIGVTWTAVFWGLCGGLLGVSFAPPAGRLRSMLMFPASGLLAAKAGGITSLALYGGSHDAAGAIAAVAGIILHPVIAAAIRSIPGFFSSRLGLPQPKDRPE